MRSSVSFIAFVLFASALRGDLPRAVSGDLYLSDYNNDRVVVYSGDGELLRTFTAPGLNGPRGVVFGDSGEVFVASQLSNQIYRFDQADNFLGSFTATGLSGPTGLAIASTGELYVANFSGGFISVFSQGGTFLRTFTAPGFTTPNCVAFDSSGNIYASSAVAALVFKWDANEQFITSFGHPTTGGLVSPMGIARDSADVLYVAGGSSHNIVKFQTDGTYLGELSHPDLTGPQGVAFDDRGHLFSPSFFQDRIVEFDSNEAYVQTVTTGGLNIPRTIAFQPARARRRNDANNTNAQILSARNLPMIGGDWTASVDSSGAPSATLAVLFGFKSPLEAALGLGVVLVDPSSVLLFQDARGILGIATDFDAPIPNDPGLVGFELSFQGALLGGGVTLSNALDLKLGAY